MSARAWDERAHGVACNLQRQNDLWKKIGWVITHWHGTVEAKLKTCKSTLSTSHPLLHSHDQVCPVDVDSTMVPFKFRTKNCAHAAQIFSNLAHGARILRSRVIILVSAGFQVPTEGYTAGLPAGLSFTTCNQSQNLKVSISSLTWSSLSSRRWSRWSFERRTATCIEKSLKINMHWKVSK